MKKIVLFLQLLIFATTVSGQYSAKELLHLPWGEEDFQAGFREAPGGPFGPMSFTVKKDTVYLLDTQNNAIKIFTNRSLLSKTSLPLRYADDFVWRNTGRYFLLAENSVQEIVNNSVMQTYAPESAQLIISSLLLKPSGKIAAVLNETESVIIQDDKQQILSKRRGIFDRRDNTVQIVKKDWQTIRVSLNRVSFDITSAAADLAAAKYIGSTPSDEFYIYVEKIVRQIPLQVKREVRLYDSAGKLKATFDIPGVPYTSVFKEFEVDEKGNLYHLITVPDGIYILGWMRENNDFKNVPVFRYPDKFRREKRHDSEEDDPFSYRSGLEKRVEERTLPGFPPVTRNEALAIGDTYVQHQWTATAANLTNGRIRDPNNVEVETPSWVRVGENRKIPYQWGGFMTLPQYDQGIAQGKYAGDIATTGVSDYCVGVDCSGFVSQCWKLPSHYSTRMMDDHIARAYSSWSQLKPADAVHKPGHVRLFVGFNPNGSLLTVEASGRDWRVSYRSYYLSSLSEYTPRYYIYMQGMPGGIPKPELQSICFNDSAAIAWVAPDTTSVSGYHLYTGDDQSGWSLVQNPEKLPVAQRFKKYSFEKDIPHFFKMMSVSAIDDSSESFPSDTYGYLDNGSNDKLLIVDGFDRISGSYPFPYHSFAMTTGQALARFNVAFETVSNEVVSDSLVNLADYYAVVWLLGDESTEDETFSNTEQKIVKSYLQQGGRLFVSGSEVAWDLDYKGSNSDKNFIHDFLFTQYDQDDANSYTVSGSPGTIFAGVTVHYDDGTKGVYEEDWPDSYKPVNGSFAALKYANGLIAATAYEGLVPDGSVPAKVLLMGFPFETIYEETERFQVMEKVLQFFDLTTSVAASSDRQPQEFVLYENYPNPFNGTTIIRYRLFSEEEVELQLFDALGRRIRLLIDKKQPAGDYRIVWDGLDDLGRAVPSGVYFTRIKAGNLVRNNKMMVLK